MNATDTGLTTLEDRLNDAEINLDEDILSEECKCEITHIDGECSIKVTHLIKFCTGLAMMCFNAAVGRTEAMETGVCIYCSCPASRCWSIRTV